MSSSCSRRRARRGQGKVRRESGGRAAARRSMRSAECGNGRGIAIGAARLAPLYRACAQVREIARGAPRAVPPQRQEKLSSVELVVVVRKRDVRSIYTVYGPRGRAPETACHSRPAACVEMSRVRSSADDWPAQFF